MSLFAGQYFDDETSLHYNYFRYYDPQSGRYITSDPIGLEGGYNTYLYAQANPVAFTDALGLCPACFSPANPLNPLNPLNPANPFNPANPLNPNNPLAPDNPLAPSPIWNTPSDEKPDWWPPDVPHPNDSPNETQTNTESCPTEPVENWDSNRTPPGPNRNFCAALAAATYKRCTSNGGGLGKCITYATTAYLGCMAISGGGGFGGGVSQ